MSVGRREEEAYIHKLVLGGNSTGLNVAVVEIKQI